MRDEELRIAQSLEQAIINYTAYCSYIIEKDEDIENEKKAELYNYSKSVIRGFTDTFCNQLNENLGLGLKIEGVYDGIGTAINNDNH